MFRARADRLCKQILYLGIFTASSIILNCHNHAHEEEGSRLIVGMANGVIEEDRADRSRATGAVNKYNSRVEIYAEIQAASHPVLPSNAMVTYLDEGAANIVYSLSVPLPHDETPSLYLDAFPNTQRRTDGFNFWDGKPSFHSEIHVSHSFSHSSSSFMSCVIIFSSSFTAVTPFSERNNVYPSHQNHVLTPFQASFYVYVKNYPGQLHVLLHKQTSCWIYIPSSTASILSNNTW
jgi:hypothetical protein